MSSKYRYKVSEGNNLPHNPLPSILGPRPIGWISSCDAQGSYNLAPYSFFNIFNYHPPIVAFSSVGKKDTVRNVQAVGDFVYNLATRALAEQVNASSTERAGVNEFADTGLTPAPALMTRSPLVAESPVSLECQLIKVEPLTSAAGVTLDTWMVLGEIVAVHIDTSLLVEGIYNTAAAQPILRAGGAADYFQVLPEGLFHMRRPK